MGKESFLGDGLVPIPPLQAIAPDYLAQNQDCGLKCSESSPQQNLDSSLWKTLQGLSITDFEQCLEDSEWRDIQRKLKSSRQRNSAHPTKGSDYLLLPTLTSGSKKKGSRAAGQVKLEVKLKELGLIPSSQQLNAQMMALLMGFPQDWTTCLSQSPPPPQEESEVATSTGDLLSPPVPLLHSVELNSSQCGGEMIDTTLQRIYWFLSGSDRPYSSKEIAIALQLDIDEVGKILIDGRDKYFVQPSVFQWTLKMNKITRETVKQNLYVIDHQQALGIVRENLGFGFTVYWIKPDSEITYNWERDSDVIERLAVAPQELIPQPPNLGKTFDGDARLATTEDIKLLSPGDFIKAKDEPWCYKFKRWDNDICIGVWEGKEFLIPQHSLSVCTLIDSRIVDKFKDAKVGDILPVGSPLSENLPSIKRDDTELKKVVEGLEQGFKQIAEESKKQMAFQFPQTEAIAQQIAQLQEQLNKLTASIEPYRECEQKANDLLQQVAEHAQMMRDKGIEERSLLDWANKIYSSITGAELEQSDSEAIKVFRDENEILIKKVESLQDELRKISISSVEATAKLSACEKVNGELRAEILRLSAQNSEELLPVGEELESSDESREQADEIEVSENILQVGTIVQRQDGQVGKVTFVPEKFTRDLIVGTNFLDGTFNLHAADLKIISQPEIEVADTVKLVDACGDEELEDFIGRTGAVVGLSKDSVCVFFKNADGFDEFETIVPSFGLRIIAKNPRLAAEAQISEFVDKIKTKKSADAIAWEQVNEVCQTPEQLKELALACQTKTQKNWFASLPELLADYINRTGDRSDLEWIGDSAKAKVEALLAPEETPF